MILIKFITEICISFWFYIIINTSQNTSIAASNLF